MRNFVSVLLLNSRHT